MICNNYKHSLHLPIYTKLLFMVLKFEFCFNIEFIDLTDCSEISTIIK